MPFVPFTKKSAAKDPDFATEATESAAPAFSKKFARKRKPSKVAPAQKKLMNPGGRSMGGGGR